ncbi:CorA family divalent cation transporter [Streptomyces sp. Caat 7-52]|uniref:magnesium transporter CorA family protein n=1 Tax=Streptomyces sp. Caat 7-52 TaxID=2949637 RepID=UPI0020357A97|nr:CorA family divalent cation transporter [Streptomyces sp. Caat 7-52]
MIVTVVSMPELTVTRTDIAEARTRLATDHFVLVDIELPEEVRPGTQQQETQAGTPQQDRMEGQRQAPQETESLAAQLGLDAASLDWFGRAGEPARAEYRKEGTGLIVPVVHEDQIIHIHAVVTERFLATTHRGHAYLARTITEVLRHERPTDPVAVLFLLLGEALGTYRQAAVQALLETEELEDDMFEKRSPEQVYRLAQLRRHSALLHHSLRPFLEVTDQILTRRMASPNFPEERQRLAREFQTSGRLVLADIESLQEATRRAFASYSSLIAGEQNGVINRLAIVSVVFLPLSFITGFFGMNFTFLTDKLESRDEFWLLAVGLQVLVLFASLYILHRTRIWRSLRENE